MPESAWWLNAELVRKIPVQMWMAAFRTGSNTTNWDFGTILYTGEPQSSPVRLQTVEHGHILLWSLWGVVVMSVWNQNVRPRNLTVADFEIGLVSSRKEWKEVLAFLIFKVIQLVLEREMRGPCWDDQGRIESILHWRILCVLWGWLVALGMVFIDFHCLILGYIACHVSVDQCKNAKKNSVPPSLLPSKYYKRKELRENRKVLQKVYLIRVLW